MPRIPKPPLELNLLRDARFSDPGPLPDGPALRHRRPRGGLSQFTAAIGIVVTLAASLTAEAGDILRGGAPAGVRGIPSQGVNNATVTATQAKANASDALSRTTQAVQSVKAMQAAARAAFASPNVPDGLAPGGLQVANGVPLNLAKPVAGEDPTLWQGASLPMQSSGHGGTTVTIVQNAQTAVLTWKSFNIGRNTTLAFDQSQGGGRQTEWIAFNKVNDPTGVPSQILGSIQASGQVYVINQNGIIFGGSSQVNVHTLVASSLPINDGLIARGLLNQEAGNVQFLFSSVGSDPTLLLPDGVTTYAYTLVSPVAAGTTPALSYTDASGPNPLIAGSDYTLSNDATGKTVATFTASGVARVGTAPIQISYTSASGNVVVQPGAMLTSPTTAAHVGGRIALVAPNVINQGTISTVDGQTILAAGREVGFAEHPSTDPSLRGIDVFVGTVNGQSGTASNTGLIDAPRADVIIAGREVDQFGVIDSSTSVSLNGRIDLLANYGAVPNPQFDPTTGALSPFLFTSAGTVEMGAGSVTRIIPELSSTDTVVGSELAIRSQVNVQGQAIHFAGNSTLLAPNANVTIAAGNWSFAPPLSTFINSAGQVYFDSGAEINVAGSADVSVPITQNFLTLQLRGAELADSPLQRTGVLRAVDITIDIRNTGTYNGLAWVGTPLGDASGFVGLIQHTVGELTTAGGTVTISAGESVVMQPGSKVDVSGGWINFTGGMVQTTRVWSMGRLLDISQATPDRVYDGIYTGTYTDASHAKYGITNTYTNPLALSGSHYEASYVQGADGGVISITAPSMALDGTLLGLVVDGPRQRQTPPAASELSLAFRMQINGPGFPTLSPTPPNIAFENDFSLPPAEPFLLAADGTPSPLGLGRKANVLLSPKLLSEDGFGNLTIDNSDGDITVPANVTLKTPAKGLVTLSAANIDVAGQIEAPGGNLSFTVYNYSPYESLDTSRTDPYPPIQNRGLFHLRGGSELNASGTVVDDRQVGSLDAPLAPDGGAISIVTYAADLTAGSVIDVSGGVSVSAAGARTYGNGGSITIAAGQDPGQGRGSDLGGQLVLGSTLKGFSGSKGGSLSIQAQLVQIGGTAAPAGALLLTPQFFSTGGFGSFALTGLGAVTPLADQFVPGIYIAPGTVIAPVAESLVAVPNAPGSDGIVLQPIDLPVGQRTPVSLSFKTPGVTRPDGTLLVRGNFLMDEGAAISTDPGAAVTIAGQTIAVLGSIKAPAGAITLAGANSFPLAVGDLATDAQTTVYLGPHSVLSAAGATVLVPDPFGRRLGSVLPGGTISVSGNLVADQGAVLDVSGTSGILDLPPAVATGTGGGVGQIAGVPLVPSGSGITSPLWSIVSVPTRIDSNGGTITLKGGQFLFTDATLSGHAGGPSALGGNLSVSSGRFYPPGVLATPADITLNVTQIGPTRSSAAFPVGEAAIGQPVLALDGQPGGHFAVNSFVEGGFDSLTLGGNVQFLGPVTINARRELTIASGGVLTANAPVVLIAAHATLGTPFLPPSPAGQGVAPFEFLGNPFGIPPTFGPGSLTVQANLIDIGNLSLQNIGNASLIADNGDIRGNGTFDMAGDLYLRAGQIYPVTAVQFTIVAYDHTENGVTTPGSITVAGSGQRDLPLSAGGQLALFASRIDQGGVLRAPGGTIQIGWNDAATAPTDLVAQTKVPLAQQVALDPGSITSVSLVDPRTGAGALIPYGYSTDGSNWIDPTGTDISAGKLANKSVSILGATLAIAQGSTIDVSGGGDYYAYRFNKGNGGSTDILGWNFQGSWQAGTAYQETQVVSYKGAFYYARTDLPTDALGTPPSPGQNWRQVTQSFAVIPGYKSDFAPYAAFGGGSDPGYVQNGLNVGDRVYLGASNGLPAGTYTLLPARYALLPGAVLVTPETGAPIGTFENPDGSSFVSGYRFNDLNSQRTLAPTFTRFEVAPESVFRAQAQYFDLSANQFLAERATTLEVTIPRLPADAGYLQLVAATGLTLEGNVLGQGQPGYHGADIDIATTQADILIGNSDSGATATQVVLNAGRLDQFHAESLLIGGVREFGAQGTTVQVLTNNITVDNAGAPLAAPEIILAATTTLTLEKGAQVAQSGTIAGTGRADTLLLGDAAVPGSGNGVLLRVSSDPLAQTIRAGVDTTDTTPAMTIAAGARIAGSSVLIDSTAGTSVDSTARLDAEILGINSGQIVLQLDPTLTVPASGLVLTGSVLQSLGGSSSLSLLSYRSLDIYGSGTLDLSGALALHAAEIRGFDNGGGTSTIRAASITLDNSAGTVGPGPDPALNGALAGTLLFDTASLHIGTGNLQISQFQLVDVAAPKGVYFTGTGSLTTLGDFHAETPFAAGFPAIKNSIVALGNLTFDATAVGATAAGSDLGASLALKGASVVATSDFVFQSGSLTLEATGNDPGDGVTIGGKLDVTGTAQSFYDVTRFTGGGNIQIISKSGSVTVEKDAVLDVSAPAGGGDAGSVSISAPNGLFKLDGAMLGKAGAGGAPGSFSLEVSALPLTSPLATTLNNAGFTEAQSFRVRTGSVTIDSTSTAHTFLLSTDGGNILVTGMIDASGQTGGRIDLISAANLTLAGTSTLTVAGQNFDDAGKGGAITLEAGAEINGAVDYTGGAGLDIQKGSQIILSVAAVDGIADPVARASAITAAQSLGMFTGTLHLRAPQTADGTGVNIHPVAGTIEDASSIVVEGYRLFDLQQGGQITNNGGIQALGGVIGAGVDVQDSVTANGSIFTANTAAISGQLFSGANAGLATLASIVPGAEIINRSGNISIGTADTLTSFDDWNLSNSHFDSAGNAGATGVPGVLTIRASGNLVFFNGLSDGFVSSAYNALLSAATPGLAANAQSWSYRLTAGADLSAADFRQVQSPDSLAPGSGSLLLGKQLMPSGRTISSIVPPLFQVIRTGSGDIQITTGRDVVLENLFANIYTAGTRLTDADVSMGGTFDLPQPRTPFLNAVQYSFAGGNVTIAAGGNIERDAIAVSGDPGTQEQLPFNWLDRRGSVDPATGLFELSPNPIANDIASTSWWVDFNNFFEGVGALGGGNVAMVAGGSVVNVDAVIPTNARMPGKDANGLPIAPDPSTLIELGGGDLLVKAGGDIDGGAYYVERGHGTLSAGGAITTDELRNSALTDTNFSTSANWLPTTLFLGKGSFNVSALGNVLLGPTANPFLLPSEFLNDLRYRTFFSTYAASDALEVTSIGGSVTLQTDTAPPAPGPSVPPAISILSQWSTKIQSEATDFVSPQPWLRLSDVTGTDFGIYDLNASLLPSTLKLTSFSGDVNLAGRITLSSSPSGTLELVAAGAVNGLQPTGGSAIVSGSAVNGTPITVWSPSQINLSDSDPAAVPSLTAPLSYQNYVAANPGAVSPTGPTDGGVFAPLAALFSETGSTTGSFASKRALHGSSLLHAADPDPVRIYAGGNISGFTLFTPKFAQIFSGHDITDVAFYLQNAGDADVSIVAAHRDIIPYDSNSALRVAATSGENFVADSFVNPATGTVTIPDSEAGDVQIAGLGVLEVLAGRNLDLGAGLNRPDGTGTGIVSIGNGRNPNLPFPGADIIGAAGIGDSAGLANSTLNFDSLNTATSAELMGELAQRNPDLLGGGSGELTDEQKAILALDLFFLTLRDVGRAQAGTVTSTTGFAPAYAAIDTLFGTGGAGGMGGDITTQARDIRTRNGGSISLLAPQGSLTLASTTIGNPLIPPGIVTEAGGNISIFTDGDVDIGISRIFTLRGGDIIIWSSNGNIAAGNSAKTVKSAPPTRVLVDLQSADVQTDLAGLATGGGIGVLATVTGVKPGDVDLIAPKGVVDAGDAGIRATGNLSIAATAVLNASNITVGGTSTGVPTTTTVAAPALSVPGAGNATTATSNQADELSKAAREQATDNSDTSSEITVEVLGFSTEFDATGSPSQ